MDTTTCGGMTDTFFHSGIKSHPVTCLAGLFSYQKHDRTLPQRLIVRLVVDYLVPEKIAQCDA
jgi:hypothetical protein